MTMARFSVEDVKKQLSNKDYYEAIEELHEMYKWAQISTTTFHKIYDWLNDRR